MDDGRVVVLCGECRWVNVHGPEEYKIEMKKIERQNGKRFEFRTDEWTREMIDKLSKRMGVSECGLVKKWVAAGIIEELREIRIDDEVEDVNKE